MMKSYNFPSTYEATNQEFSHVADCLLNGIKLKLGNNDYIIGNLALREGYSPHKNINTGPGEEEYKLLAQAGLLLATSENEGTINLTVGFPFSTYMLYRDQVDEVLGGKHVITFDKGTFGDCQFETKEIVIANVDVMPEIAGCITALREGALHVQGNFFMVSLGFGTCEAAVSMSSGMLNRSTVSMNGINYAVKLFEHELMKKYYMELKTEHQLDILFQKGQITINRVRHDVTDLRKKVLRMYYNDVISPRLRKSFIDDEFSKCNQMYLAGGGAYYPELVECFREEFGDTLTISVYPEPEKCASHGYCLNSKLKARTGANSFETMDPDDFLKNVSQLAVGLDVGNANTCVCLSDYND